MEACPKCRDFIFREGDVCKCRPFIIRNEEWLGEDSATIYASDMEEAVEKAAEDLDSDGHLLLEETQDFSAEDEEGNVTTYSVSAHVSIDYTLTKK